jgi:hypothetical protein
LLKSKWKFPSIQGTQQEPSTCQEFEVHRNENPALASFAGGVEPKRYSHFSVVRELWSCWEEHYREDGSGERGQMLEPEEPGG